MPTYFATLLGPDGKTFIYARDEIAQQCFFGWGSDRNAVEASMYGRSNFQIQCEAPETVGRDSMTWRWDIGHPEADYLLAHYHSYKNDPDYYNADELERMAELELILLKISKNR